MVCLIATISPGPATNSHKFPVLFLGEQLTLTESSFVVDINDPINTAVGCILIFRLAVKSKSDLVIPNKQISGSPHNGDTSIILFKLTICGNSFKFVDFLNLDPSTCESTAIPISNKSCGDNEKQPISDKSTSINIV